MSGLFALRAGVVLGAALAMADGSAAFAQGPPPVIRAIVIDRNEVFDSSEVRQF